MSQPATLLITASGAGFRQHKEGELQQAFVKISGNTGSTVALAQNPGNCAMAAQGVLASPSASNPATPAKSHEEATSWACFLQFF